MKSCPDLSAILAGLYDKPLLGPKPNQLLVFKRPQLAVKLESLMQVANSAAAKHMNTNLVNQAVAAFYQHQHLHDHVVGWAPIRSGQLNAEVHLSFRDASAQHRQQLASTGAIQVTMPGSATPVSLPVSTVAAKQLPEVTMVRLHNVPGGINVHGLMECLLKHFQFGPEYSIVSEYGGDVSGDIFFFFFFFFFFFGLQDSCLFLSSKKAFRTPDEPEIRRNNGPVCIAIGCSVQLAKNLS